jgi:hypothetical protein
MIGRIVAHDRIAAKLGQGGMGEVHRATDTKLRRELASRFRRRRSRWTPGAQPRENSLGRVVVADKRWLRSENPRSS